MLNRGASPVCHGLINQKIRVKITQFHEILLCSFEKVICWQTLSQLWYYCTLIVKGRHNILNMMRCTVL